ELLGGGKRTKGSSAERIEATLAACWGPMLVARWLWRELGLENILDGLAPKTSRVQKAGRLRLADRGQVLERTLENEGTIYISDSDHLLISNTLSLTLKNKGAQSLLPGSGPWPSNSSQTYLKF